jgi:hypothetical protein
MRHFILSVCLSCALVGIAAGWAWQRWLNTELSPTEYASLLSLRRLDPQLFKDKVLPGLEKALEDKVLTHGELRVIEQGLPGLGSSVLAELTAPTLGEQLEDAQRKGLEAGRGLGDSLGKALDDLSDFIQRKSDELTAPKSKPEPPATF